MRAPPLAPKEIPILAYVRFAVGNHAGQRKEFLEWLDLSLKLVIEDKERAVSLSDEATEVESNLSTPFYYYNNEKARELIGEWSQDLSKEDIPEQEELGDIVDGVLLDQNIQKTSKIDKNMLELINHILVNQLALIESKLESLQDGITEIRNNFRNKAWFSEKSQRFFEDADWGFVKKKNFFLDSMKLDNLKYSLENLEEALVEKDQEHIASFLGCVSVREKPYVISTINKYIAEHNSDEAFISNLRKLLAADGSRFPSQVA